MKMSLRKKQASNMRKLISYIVIFSLSVFLVFLIHCISYLPLFSSRINSHIYIMVFSLSLYLISHTVLPFSQRIYISLSHLLFHLGTQRLTHYLSHTFLLQLWHSIRFSCFIPLSHSHDFILLSFSLSCIFVSTFISVSPVANLMKPLRSQFTTLGS